MENLMLKAILLGIVLVAFLCLWLSKHFASMSPEEKEIYEDKLKCPFDGEHCGVIGRSVKKSYVTRTCLNCPRYDNFIKKGLDEKELRDKLKKITDEN